MQLTYLIIVKGEVQGVFFRQHTKEKALDLGLTGTVMNERDGSVKIIATGTRDQLQQLEAWCHHGPSRAKVEKVITEELPVQPFGSFTIIRH